MPAGSPVRDLVDSRYVATALLVIEDIEAFLMKYMDNFKTWWLDSGTSDIQWVLGPAEFTCASVPFIPIWCQGSNTPYQCCCDLGVDPACVEDVKIYNN